LLRYALDDEPLCIDETRLEMSTSVFFEDLQRQAPAGVSLRRSASVEVDGLGSMIVPILISRGSHRLAVGLSCPLTQEEPVNACLRQLRDYSIEVPVLLVDELLVQRNLPRATKEVLDRIPSDLPLTIEPAMWSTVTDFMMAVEPSG